VVPSAPWYAGTTVTRLLVLLAALAMLTLPVSYRGGAEFPHSHASLQLWFDAAHGSTDHHRRFEDGHEEHAADALSPARATVLPAPDVPAISKLVSHELPSVIAVSAVFGLVLARFRLSPVWAEIGALVGLSRRPEIPPPRPLPAPV